MLPERDSRLLTAYVDGDLDKRQRGQVLRLLRRSREARQVLRRLLRDSRALKAVTVPALAVDLTDTILGTIASKRLEPAKARPRMPSPVGRSFPMWVGVAAAAAVLLVVGIGSFFYFLPGPRSPLDPGRHVAENQGLPTPVEKETSPTPANQVTQNEEGPPKPLDNPKREVPPPAPPLPHDPIVLVPGEEEDPATEIRPEKPPEARRDVLGAGGREGQDRFEKVELQVPVIVKLHDLDGVLQRDKLLRELRPGGIFRVEVLCRDATRAVERLRPALRRQGISLQVDATAQIRLKKPYWKSDYSLFVENISPAELADLLTQAGVEDRKAQAAKASDGRFDGSLVVAPLSRRERQTLNEMVGVDLARAAVPVPSPVPLTPVDIHRPLPEATEEHVGAALEGKGLLRPSASPRSGPNQALLLHSTTSRNRPTAEVKRFHAARKPAQPGTIQILLVLRYVGN